MSNMQRCRKFLDDLSDTFRDKAFDFCTERDWKLSSNDTDIKNPDFGELKKYILSKALSIQKYNKERVIEDYEERCDNC